MHESTSNEYIPVLNPQAGSNGGTDHTGTDQTSADVMSATVSTLTGDQFSLELQDDSEILCSVEQDVTLSGREEETTILHAALLKLLPVAPPEQYQATTESLTHGSISSRSLQRTVLIHGESGSGKTVLAETLRNPLVAANGFFCSGKFFQTQQEPYSAVMTAFSNLCELCMLPDSNVGVNQRLEIRKRLGADGPVLAQAISSLWSFLHPTSSTACGNSGPQGDGGSVQEEEMVGDIASLPSDSSAPATIFAKSETAFAKFKVACRSFLIHMSSPDRPIIIFIDDIQWMDQGSVQLLQFLLKDTEVENVLLILAYRDGENENLIQELVGDYLANDSVTDIALKNLSADGVNTMVTSVLQNNGVLEAGSSAQDLGELTFQKTLGNPFHVIQFMDSIHHRGLLNLHPVTNEWSYDVENIRQKTCVTDNLADLLSCKIQRLKPEIQEALKVASFVGFKFNADIVIEVIEATNNNFGSSTSALIGDEVTASKVKSFLNHALKESLIEKTSIGYQFSHDKIQAAFQSTMEEAHKLQLHEAIGEAHLVLAEKEKDVKKAAEYTYYAIRHLHQANVPKTVQGRVRLVELGLKASKYCIIKSAFIDAGDLLRNGIRLLDPVPEKWTTHFDLAYEMTELLAQMEFVLGNTEAACKQANEAILKGKSIEMKTKALLVNVEARMAANEVSEAIAAGNEALALLGIKIPLKITLRHVLTKLLKVKRMIGWKTDEVILGLPLVNDAIIATTVRILFNSSSFFSAQSQSNSAGYFSLLSMELTLRHGLTSFSAAAFAAYAVAQLALHNQQAGMRFGSLAAKLMKKVDSRPCECPTTGLVEGLINHWNEPFLNLANRFDRPYSAGLEAGDVVFSTIALGMDITLKFLTGTNLSELEKFTQRQSLRIFEIGGEEQLSWVKPIAQFLQNMQARVTSFRALTTLTGDVMNEDDFTRIASNVGNKAQIWTVLYYKFQLSYYFGFYRLAHSLLRRVRSVRVQAELNFNFGTWHVLGALTNYELYRRTRKWAYLREARYYRRKVEGKSWCPNVSPFLSLLTGEELSLKGHVAQSSVVEAYDRSIHTMEELGWVHMEGLACERAGLYLESIEDLNVAPTYFDRALKLYGSDWGATAKYQWLQRKAVCSSSRTLSFSEPAPLVGSIIDIKRARGTSSS